MEPSTPRTPRTPRRGGDAGDGAGTHAEPLLSLEQQADAMVHLGRSPSKDEAKKKLAAAATKEERRLAAHKKIAAAESERLRQMEVRSARRFNTSMSHIQQHHEQRKKASVLRQETWAKSQAHIRQRHEEQDQKARESSRKLLAKEGSKAEHITAAAQEVTSARQAKFAAARENIASRQQSVRECAPQSNPPHPAAVRRRCWLIGSRCAARRRSARRRR